MRACRSHPAGKARWLGAAGPVRGSPPWSGWPRLHLGGRALRGKRLVWGGRGRGRAALYMAALSATRHNPAIGAFYQRLLRAGKAKKVAPTACMHKLLLILNAIVHAGTPWRQPAAVVGA